jgi:cytochrome c peroxidase
LDGTGLSDAELETLVDYVERLPGPNRSDVTNASAKRGEQLFFDAAVGCADCHDADGGVDGVQHELEGVAVRDTPSLQYVAGTAPFFHDGRYATLLEMLEHSSGSMGQDQPLSEAARRDLVAYLRTL